MPTITAQEKYHDTNPVVRFLLNRFFSRIRDAVSEAAPVTVLDAGCGEGELMRRGVLSSGLRVTSMDLRPEALALFRSHTAQRDLVCASVVALPFADRSMDTVLCLEVLEHLERPELALAELARVARRSVILSVPHEPYFQAGNLVRGKHLYGWGNHPEHVQHWNPATFHTLLKPVFGQIQMIEAFPWIIANCARNSH